MARQAFFAGQGNLPKFLNEPAAFVALHLEAVRAINEGQPEQAELLLQQSADQRPLIKGQTAGGSFNDMRDSDDLLGSVVEFFSQGDYFWISLGELNKLEVARPHTLRDLLWIPAKIELVGALQREVFIPVLYPGSSQDPDDQIKLGRMTAWKPLGRAAARGVGARVYVLDDSECPLLELQTVKFSEAA